MVRANTSGIPYPSTDPRYQKVWARMTKRGETLEQALDDTHPRERGKPGPKYLKGKPTREAEILHLCDLQSCSAPSIHKDPPTPAPDPGPGLDALLKELGKQTIFLGIIARAIDQIADRVAPQPGLEGTVTLSTPPHAPRPPAPRRESENGFGEGDRVQKKGNGEIGQVTRILPGRKDVEVRFRNCTLTLKADQVEPVKASG